MKRETQFRVWDKIDKQFTVLNIGNLRDDYSFDDYIDDTFNDPNSRYILVQYTGLNDKNGKEIYEGDILQLFNPKQTFYVKFEDGCFLLEPEPTGLFLYEENKKAEIIGNIFENPELLK
jgi:uncharacterized phage protein (TIGR01671 family)